MQDAYHWSQIGVWNEQGVGNIQVGDDESLYGGFEACFQKAKFCSYEYSKQTPSYLGVHCDVGSGGEGDVREETSDV